MDSLRNRILAALDLKKELVRVPEWEVEVEVKSLTGRERARLLQSVLGRDGRTNFERLYSEVVILSAYDPVTGKPVFEAADRDALNEKSGAALERIAQVAMRLSGLTEAAIEEASKNLSLGSEEPTASSLGTSAPPP